MVGRFFNVSLNVEKNTKNIIEGRGQQNIILPGRMQNVHFTFYITAHEFQNSAKRTFICTQTSLSALATAKLFKTTKERFQSMQNILFTIHPIYFRTSETFTPCTNIKHTFSIQYPQSLPKNENTDIISR